MQTQQLQMLIAIAEEGSLRAAARRLGKSQPALTKSLRLLEAEVGTAIFERTARGVLLTPMGARIHRRAVSIAHEVQRLHDDVHQSTGAESGMVSLCVSPVMAHTVIPRAVAAFRQAWPNVRLRLVDGIAPEALVLLREGSIDLLAGPVPLGNLRRGFRIDPLFETRLIIATRATNPLAGARSIGELLHGHWLIIGADKGPGRIFESAFRALGLAPPPARTSSDSLAATLGMLEAMDCYCVMPARLFDLLDRRLALVAVPIVEPLPDVSLGIVTRADAALTPAAADLLQHLRNAAGRTG
ncbi:MAG: LysR substrate-binding domain-containing protein [Burkholderiaceae bacterium]